MCRSSTYQVLPSSTSHLLIPPSPALRHRHSPPSAFLSSSRHSSQQHNERAAVSLPLLLSSLLSATQRQLCCLVLVSPISNNFLNPEFLFLNPLVSLFFLFFEGRATPKLRFWIRP